NFNFQLQTLILAGAETTFVTLTWILSNLLNNRRSMELAQQELDAKVGRTRIVQPSDIDNLVYIQAIVKETLRLYPAAPVGVPHEAIEDCSINGYSIPKKTRIFTNLWKLHRDPNVWSDPEEFKPERFLEEQRNDYRASQFEYIPFGSGRRSCPGMGFALQVMNLTVARLLQGFSITTLRNEAVDMGEGIGLTLPKAIPLEVRIVPRLIPSLYQ
ncbi:Cytochrome P450 CYP82J17, partial [Linum perenne]